MQYIIVTGASTGIGRAVAEHFLKKGAYVFGSVRKETDAELLKSTLGDHFEPLIFDVRDNEAIKKAAEIVKNRVGTEGVSLLVNNAGIAVSGPLQHLDIEDYQTQFDINVFGVQRVTQAFLPLLGASFTTKIKQKGMIINISSISSMVTTPFLGAYSASKIALEYWSDALRRELSIYGIRVVNISAGGDEETSYLHDPLSQIVEECSAVGVTVVCAAPARSPLEMEATPATARARIRVVILMTCLPSRR